MAFWSPQVTFWLPQVAFWLPQVAFWLPQASISFHGTSRYEDEDFFPVLGRISSRNRARKMGLVFKESSFHADSEEYKAYVICCHFSRVMSQFVTLCDELISQPPPILTKRRKMIILEKFAFQQIGEIVSVVPKALQMNPPSTIFLGTQPKLSHGIGNAMCYDEKMSCHPKCFL